PCWGARGGGRAPVRDRSTSRPGDVGQYRPFAIAVNEVRRQVQVQQTPKRFAGHGSGNDIAPYYNLVNIRLTNILKGSLQGWEVPMNIVEGSNSHREQDT